MDFSVKDFNVRLRTIKLWELIIAMLYDGILFDCHIWHYRIQ